MTLTTVLIIVSAFAVLMTIFFFREKLKRKNIEGIFNKKVEDEKVKFNIKYNKMKEILSDDKLMGYYLEDGWTYKEEKIKFNVFVEEVDRYTNGESKIKFDHMEIIKCPDQAKKALIEKVKKGFLTIIKTSDVEWLISEEDIREIRRKKLEAIEKLYKDN